MWQIVVVNCKLMATLKLAVPKSGSPIFLLKKHMLSTIDLVAFVLIGASSSFTSLAGKTTNTTTVKNRNYFQICDGMMCKI